VDSNRSPPDHRPSRPFAAQKKAEHVPGRSVVRTILDLDAETHRAAVTTPCSTCGGSTRSFTTPDPGLLDIVAADSTAGTQLSNQTTPTLMGSALAHLPSGLFTANAAWLGLEVLTSTSASGRRPGCGRARAHLLAGPTDKYGRSKASLVSAAPSS
jgi:hypothetical protein